MTEPNTLIINVPLYALVVTVIWDVDMEGIKKYARRHKVEAQLSEKWIKDVAKAMKDARGLCAHLGYNNTDVLVWLKERPTKATEYGVLYHELYHAVDWIARPHNLKKEIEARAYLFEYLVTECNKFLWNEKDKA